LFFADYGASANHIRIALERILDHLKVKKFELKRGKRVFISLHKRILLLPSKYNDVSDLLFAIKWLGNTGSHSHKITIDDVMDAYEILEVVLNEIIENKTKKIKKMAKKINKRKGLSTR